MTTSVEYRYFISNVKLILIFHCIRQIFIIGLMIDSIMYFILICEDLSQMTINYLYLSCCLLKSELSLFLLYLNNYLLV